VVALLKVALVNFTLNEYMMMKQQFYRTACTLVHRDP